MHLANWDFAAVLAAFLASLVEAVEAFTIVLAVGTLRGRAPALAGTVSGLAVLCLAVLAGGSLLAHLPLRPLQFVVGLSLLLFGLMWLRKAVLRTAGLKPLHDEEAIFEREQAELIAAEPAAPRGFDWLAATVAFKAVLLEGLEVIFIVLAVGAVHGRLVAASIGAAAACLAVLAAGIAVRRPLARVPENTLTFGVGVLLCAFGVFWTGEALHVPWPNELIAFPLLAGLVLAASLGLAWLLRKRAA